MNFLDLPQDLADFETAKAVVLSIPYEATTTYGKGTRSGPQAIIEASSQVELYDEELNVEPCQLGISTLRPFTQFSTEPEEATNEISEACKKLLRANKFVVGLGGEHTVSVGLVQAFKDYYPDMWVLQLDAHSDLRDCYQGSQYNHACVMARISEFCSYVGVGIRSSIRGERERVQTPSKIFYAHEMRQNESWSDQVLRILGESVYITIDLDFFDPSVMPSVGTPEPGGFQWYEALDFLRKVVQNRRVVGFDVVELAPKAGFTAPDFLAAKLIYKLLGYIFEVQLTGSG